MINALTQQWRRMAGLSRNAKLFLSMVAINGFGQNIIWLFLTLFILARGNDKTFLGLFMSLISLAALFLSIPMGILTSQIGCKRAVLVGVFISVAANVLLVLSPFDGLLLLAAAMMGTGNALRMAAGPAFIAQNVADEDRSTAFSLQFSLTTLTGFAGSLIAGLMPAWFAALLHVGPESATAYRATLLVACGVFGISALPLLMVQERSRPSQDATSETILFMRSLLRRDILWLMTPQLIIALGAGLLIPYLNVFLKERFAIADSLLGLTFAISQLLVGLGALAAPMLAERWGELRTIVATQLLSLPLLLTLGFAPVLGVAIVALWLRAVLMNMGSPLYTTFAMRLARKEEQSTVGAMLGMAWSVGQMIGPGISGAVQQRAGFTPLFLTTGTTYLAATLLLQTFSKETEQRPAMEPEPFHTM